MKNRNTVFHLILLLTGIFGIITYIFYIEDLVCETQKVVLAAVLPCVIFWGVYRIKPKALPFAAIALCAGCILLGRDWILAQLQMLPYFLGCINGSLYWYMYDMTGFLVCIFAGISVLLFVTECVLGWHFIMWGLSAAVLFSVVFTGIDPGWLCIILLGLYQVVFAVIHFGEKAEGKPAAVRKAGGMTAGLLAVLLLVSQIIAGSGDGFLYRWAEAVDPALQQIEREISVTVKNRQNLRRVSRGNLYTTGTVVMELRAEEKPTETIYLRDFSGGTYSNGIWQPAADREILEQIDSRVGTVNLFINMYYKLNEADREKSRVLYVKRANQDSPPYGIYYGQWHSHSWRNHMLPKGEEGYAYFEKKDMAPAWNVVDGFSFEYAGNGKVIKRLETYFYDRERSLHQAYGQAAQRAYTQVNRKNFPNLSRLQQENPLEEEGDITTFIKTYLLTHGTYTASPDRIPLGQEPVEYFLFESHRGYCQHFASAATLLYRMYGVPARYAMGFAVKPSDFVENDEGFYCAVVTDEKAHAWPEIFDEELGWTPVEVTPSDDGNGSVQSGQTGFDEITAESGQPEETEPLEQENLQSGDSEKKENETAKNTGDTEENPHAVLIVFGLFLAAVGAAALGIILHLRFLRRMNCRKAFAKMLEKLQRAGILAGCDGSEEGFAQRLAEEVPGVSEEEAREAVEIVSRAAFGNTEISEEEEEAVRQLYRKIAAWVKNHRKVL